MTFDHSQPCHKPLLILPFHPIFHHSYGNSYQMLGSRHAQPREGSREGGRSEPVADEDPAWPGHLHHRLVPLAHVNHLIDFSDWENTGIEKDWEQLMPTFKGLLQPAHMTTPVQRLLSGQQQGFQTSAGFLSFCPKWLLGVFSSFQKVAAWCVCEYSKSGCSVCLRVLLNSFLTLATTK